MITVTITKSGDLVTEVIVKGHAYSNEPGKDLVCAGVSSIVTGTINAIDELGTKPKFGLEEGYACIQFESDNTNQIIAQVFVAQLKTIEETNKKFIKIIYSKREV